jgi:hypothetical protein
MELRQLMYTEPQDFELSERNFRIFVDKIAAKADQYIRTRARWARQSYGRKRVLVRLGAEVRTLSDIRDRADELVMRLQREEEGAGYTVRDGGVH